MGYRFDLPSRISNSDAKRLNIRSNDSTSANDRGISNRNPIEDDRLRSDPYIFSNRDPARLHPFILANARARGRRRAMVGKDDIMRSCRRSIELRVAT